MTAKRTKKYLKTFCTPRQYKEHNSKATKDQKYCNGFCQTYVTMNLFDNDNGHTICKPCLNKVLRADRMVLNCKYTVQQILDNPDILNTKDTDTITCEKCKEKKPTYDYEKNRRICKQCRKASTDKNVKIFVDDLKQYDTKLQNMSIDERKDVLTSLGSDYIKPLVKFLNLGRNAKDKKSFLIEKILLHYSNIDANVKVVVKCRDCGIKECETKCIVCSDCSAKNILENRKLKRATFRKDISNIVTNFTNIESIDTYGNDELIIIIRALEPLYICKDKCKLDLFNKVKELYNERRSSVKKITIDDITYDTFINWNNKRVYFNSDGKEIDYVDNGNDGGSDNESEDESDSEDEINKENKQDIDDNKNAIKTESKHVFELLKSNNPNACLSIFQVLLEGLKDVTKYYKDNRILFDMQELLIYFYGCTKNAAHIRIKELKKVDVNQHLEKHQISTRGGHPKVVMEMKNVLRYVLDQKGTVASAIRRSLFEIANRIMSGDRTVVPTIHATIDIILNETTVTSTTTTSNTSNVAIDELIKTHYTSHYTQVVAHQCSYISRDDENTLRIQISEGVIDYELLDAFTTRLDDELIQNEPDDDVRFVYCIRVRGTNHVKIGFSKDPTQRLATLQTAHAELLDLELIIRTRNYRELEQKLHNKHKDKRIRGEWFSFQEDTDLYAEM